MRWAPLVEHAQERASHQRRRCDPLLSRARPHAGPQASEIDGDAITLTPALSCRGPIGCAGPDGTAEVALAGGRLMRECQGGCMGQQLQLPPRGWTRWRGHDAASCSFVDDARRGSASGFCPSQHAARSREVPQRPVPCHQKQQSLATLLRMPSHGPARGAAQGAGYFSASSSPPLLGLTARPCRLAKARAKASLSPVR